MASLVEKLEEDLKKSLKEKDSFRAGVLRLLLSSLHNKVIEKKGQSKEPVLTDEETVDVLQKEAKKRKEAMGFYEQGHRQDLWEKEEKELKIIEAYLPAALTEEEVRKIVTAAVSQSGAKTEKYFGRVMGLVMKEVKGRADAALVTKLVKEKLAGNE